MTDFTETVKQNAVLTFSVVILSSIALTFLILLYTGIFGFGDKADVAEPIVARDTIVEGVNRADTQAFAPTVVASPKFVRVKLPMLYGSHNATPVEGKKLGCDTVYMVDAWARADGDALANHIKVLFDGITPVDFLPGNYVRTSQRDVQFVGVSVADGVARISLSGTMQPIQTECDKGRLRIQLEEIAFQYPGVTSVEIVLNGEPLQK